MTEIPSSNPRFIDCRPLLDALLAQRMTRDEVHRAVAHTIYRNRAGRLGDASSDWREAAANLNATRRLHFIEIDPFT